MVALCLLLSGAVGAFAATPVPDGGAAGGVVLVVEIDAIIQPVVAGFLADAVQQADRRRAAALVIQLDTPGGLLDSTRQIVRSMLAAETPVIVHVAPSGAQAASAGFFLLMAADVAAMAPGTNTGAAHPVQGTGEQAEGVLAEKVEQDAAAWIRSLAEGHGRSPELAESAVVESRSFTAEEALERDLIDLMAPDLDALLAQAEGLPLRAEGERGTVRTAGARIEHLEMSAVQRLLSAIAHPNIAYLLMTLGGLGLYFELANPGAVFPGVVGAVCLILGLFALSVLPVNYAGIALIALAAIFLIVEVKVTSYGLLTVAGVTSLVLGSLMLFRSADPALRVSRELIAGVALTALAVTGFLMTMAIRTHRARVRTGSEGLVSERGLARTPLGPEQRGGKVFVHGELWNAVAAESIPAGAEVIVTAVEGMTVTVRPLASGSSESQEKQI